MGKKSYNFLTIRLWAEEKNDDSGKLRITIEPEINPGFGEDGSALLRYTCALTRAMSTAAASRSEEDKILNRGEIRALCKKLEEWKQSGQIRSGELLNGAQIEEIVNVKTNTHQEAG